MFEKFTDQARRVVVLAQEDARLLGHPHIGTEHLLLGLINEGDGVAAQALEAVGVTLDGVRSRIDAMVEPGQQALSGHIPFTPRAKKVLELSLRESLQLGHDYIGTEHILLGLTRVSAGVGAQVLVGLVADLERVRQAVLDLLGEQVGPGPGGANPGMRPQSRPEPRPHRMAGQVEPRLAAIEARVAAMERRVGTGADTGDVDRAVAQTHGELQEAVRAQDFERAAELRDQQQRMLADAATRRREWDAAHPSLPELAEQCRRLADEVARLTAMLRERGIDPQDRPA